MMDVETEDYSSFVPCIHRIHQTGTSLSPGHQIQMDLGFSIDLHSLQRLLLTEWKRTAEEKVMLVTFDDGYRDVLLLEPFFDSHPIFQPVLAISTSTLHSEPLWFDRLYHFLATADDDTIHSLAKKHDILIADDVRENLARSTLKAKLRKIPPALQENKLSELNMPPQFSMNQYLSEMDLRRLVEKGWIIASHSHHHSQLTYLTYDELKYELEQSLKEVLNLGGRAWLIYPDGVWNQKVLDVASKLGFRKFFTLEKTNKITGDEHHFYRKLI